LAWVFGIRILDGDLGIRNFTLVFETRKEVAVVLTLEGTTFWVWVEGSRAEVEDCAVKFAKFTRLLTVPSFTCHVCLSRWTLKLTVFSFALVFALVFNFFFF